MHDVLYQLLRNVERISEHLSLQPPVARVTPQTGAGALNASATLQTLGLKKGEMPKGLRQSMKSMSFPFNAQEDLDLTEDKVEINSNIFLVIFFSCKLSSYNNFFFHSYHKQILKNNHLQE